MKINFAQVSHADIDTFGDEGLFGPDLDGNYFYNVVEFGTNAGGTDEVAILDGCKRYMPISVEHIPDLITALQEVQRIAAEIKFGKQITAYATGEAQAYVIEGDIEHTHQAMVEAMQRAEQY
jgi:hypothetical protein